MRGKSIIWMTIAFAMLLSAMPLAIPAAVATETPWKVYIAPAASTPEVWTEFTVSINIQNVTAPPTDDIYTWGLRLYWDPITIDYVSAAEGSYLAEGAPEGTFFIIGELPPAKNYIDLACSVLGNYTGASGDGTLATVTFAVLDIGTTEIELADIQLVDSHLYLKDYTKADGTVNIHTDWLENPMFYAVLVEKRVDNRHWSLSIQGTLITLYVKIKNEAWVPLQVKGRFAGTTPIGARKWDTGIAILQPNEVSGFLTWGQSLTTGMRGTYTFNVYAMFSYGGSRWFADSHKVKDLVFDVVD